MIQVPPLIQGAMAHGEGGTGKKKHMTNLLYFNIHNQLIKKKINPLFDLMQIS